MQLKHGKINWEEIKWEEIIREETTQENQKDGINQTNQTNLLPFETTENDFFLEYN